ncbi:OLC1v1007201C5 [Oldenlandia corymbosa var. corymbosa]|uniref:OLC1v1007201C5 n=1 Tax=Oldenlandia corymbosa var. corymbosa TaxID=529605 RepID=A0AAV1DIR8_OLDCO|nr:OLC1v1007201C5 [Oldenlandia corymbosa var. corymbosa]
MIFRRLLIIAVLGFVLGVINRADGESLTCLTVYKEGGAPAVFQSPKCPRWSLSSFGSRQRSPNNRHSARCQSAMHKGRRKSQEDRTLCALDIRIPFPGPTGIKEVAVGIIAVFDGHNGAEASEMASKLLLEYFTLHTYFLLDTTFSILLGKSTGRLGNEAERDWFFQKVAWKVLDHNEVDFGRLKLDLSTIGDESFHLEILKEALLRALHDIDVAFTMDALRYNFHSGSTAAVILIADHQILVANVGDSKAFLCSEIHQSPFEAKATLLRLYRENRHDMTSPVVKNYRSLKEAASNGFTFLIAKELTEDHHPDREDERSRVESAGGYVSEWGGVARVNGQLAVSRAIGDVYFKSYGVVSLPEVNDWKPLSVNDSYLVAATDGVFEHLNPQEICDIFWEIHMESNSSLEVTDSLSYSLADRVVDTAFSKGSVDNLAAVVLPVKSAGTFQTFLENSPDGSGEFDLPALGYIKHFNKQLVDNEASLPVEVEHTYPLVDKSEYIMVERKQNNVDCFYLSENLDEIDGYTFWTQRNDKEYTRKVRHALPDAINNSRGPLMNFHEDQSMCMFFGFGADEYNGQCTNSEGFTKLLGLLGTIPLHNADLDEQALDSRYILKKRYDRGSYGEVWLAFKWNCSNVSQSFEQTCKDEKFYFHTMHLGAYNRSSETSSSTEDQNYGTSPDSMFILKRIMVEKGAAVYLSGLREKYFGEMFLNASSVLSFSPSAGVPDCSTIKQENESTWCVDSTLSGRGDLMGSSQEGGLNHIARFVESFESRSNEIWLVFRHEGVSLSKLLYTAEEVLNNAGKGSGENFKRVQILHPSNWWHWLKTTKAGHEEMRNLIFQLLMAVKSCHDRNITHRDIKPENMVICIEDQASGRCLKGFPDGGRNYSTKMRLIDFGSALDEFTLKHLYGSLGPSRAEQTSEYAPPEAFLNASWYKDTMKKNLKYDMWSVGVIMLELILGSPNVFQISSKTRALLDKQLQGWNENVRELAYKLRSFMEMCILLPGIPTRIHHTSDTRDYGSVPPVPWKCSEEFLFQQIKNRDPLNIGFPDVMALRLVRDLLQWNPVSFALEKSTFEQNGYAFRWQ